MDIAERVDQAYFEAFLRPGQQRLLRASPHWDQLRDEHGRHALIAGAFRNPDILREAGSARQRKEIEKTKALAGHLDEHGRGLWHAAMAVGQHLTHEHWPLATTRRIRRDASGRGIIPSLLDWGHTESFAREPQLWLPSARMGHLCESSMRNVFGTDFDAGDVLACPNESEVSRVASFLIDGHDMTLVHSTAARWSIESDLTLSLQLVAMRADPKSLAELPGSIRGSMALILGLNHGNFDGLRRLPFNKGAWEQLREERLSLLLSPGASLSVQARETDLLERAGTPHAQAAIHAFLESQELGAGLPSVASKPRCSPRI